MNILQFWRKESELSLRTNRIKHLYQSSQNKKWLPTSEIQNGNRDETQNCRLEIKVTWGAELKTSEKISMPSLSIKNECSSLMCRSSALHLTILQVRIQRFPPFFIKQVWMINSISEEFQQKRGN
jgi:hypothetical protein